MGEHLDNKVLREHIEHYHTQVKQQLSTLRVIESRQTEQVQTEQLYLSMIIDFAKMTLKAKDQWCQQVLTQLPANA